MTKIACSSDWHGDWVTLGHRRHDEVARAVRRSVAVAVEERADLYLFLGDLADPDTGGDTFRTVALAIETAHQLSHHGIPSVWIAGNHDVCEDGTGASTLSAIEPLEDMVRGVYVVTSPRLFFPLPDLALVCLPFMPASHGVDLKTAAAEMMGKAKGARIVVAGHLTLPGIHPGGETTDMPRGREVVFPTEETKAATVRLNGHYHARQIYDAGDGGPKILIPGSLARLNFGEEGNDPGILVVDVPDVAP